MDRLPLPVPHPAPQDAVDDSRGAAAADNIHGGPSGRVGPVEQREEGAYGCGSGGCGFHRPGGGDRVPAGAEEPLLPPLPAGPVGRDPPAGLHGCGLGQELRQDQGTACIAAHGRAPSRQR